MEYWKYPIFLEELAANKLGAVLASTKWLFQQFWGKLGWGWEEKMLAGAEGCKVGRRRGRSQKRGNTYC